MVKMTIPTWEHVQKRFYRDTSSKLNHARFSVLVNRQTGKVIIVDGYKKRYDLMRTRVKNWADQMGKVDGPVFYKMISLSYDVFGTKIPKQNWRPNDIRDFELALREYLKEHFPDVVLYGYAWVGEIQPTSKHYHYHLVIVTGKKLFFPDGAVDRLWGRGFVKVTVAKSPFYLVAYCKKQDQKDYFYFPWGARGFAVWVAPWAISGGQKSKALLRWHSLKLWQLEYLAEHSKGDDLETDLECLNGQRSPPSNWEWKGSWVKLERAQGQADELEKKDESPDVGAFSVSA